MKHLPIGIQDFAEIRSNDFIYVDKTEVVHQLVTTGKHYFLSRPRRFGKSLLVSTLKALFEGKKDLFEGLWIAPHWNWKDKRPVLHFSFDRIDYEQSGLESALLFALEEQARRHGVQLTTRNYKTQLLELIEKVFQKHGKVVFLVDEYDKPITDYLNAHEFEQAKANRDMMREFYGVLKSVDAYLRLVFITGISKFSKTSIFSHLNNLLDITLDENFALMLGYTQEEVVAFFSRHLERVQERLGGGMEHILQRMKAWYNGYSWDGVHFLYNPFAILNFLHAKRFQNFWMASGSPKFLVEQMRNQAIYEVEGVYANSVTFEQYDIEHLALIPLLFQTGYLTVKSSNPWTGEYLLDYPNKEVRESMYQFLIEDLAPSSGYRHTGRTMQDMQQAFERNELDKVRLILASMLADLPYEVFDKTSEGLYHGLIHIVFNYLGMYADSEVHSARGRADAVVKTNTHIYIFEFKFNASAEEAIKQIKDKNYAQPYLASGKAIMGVGVGFDPQERAITGWEVTPLNEAIS
jgi:hypothetical protein